MRAAALAVAVVAAFVGVMYLRFASDAVHRPDPTPSPPSAPLSIADRCASYSRYPKPLQCGTPTGPLWWGMPTVPPAPVTPPNAIGGIGVVPLKIGPEIEIPHDLALIVHTGIPGSQSTPEGLARVYRDSAGNIRTDTLVTIQSLGLPTGSQGAYFTSFAADEDGSPIMVEACTSGSCFNGGGGQLSPDAESVIFQSMDGGVTWSPLLNLNGVAFLIDVLADGRLIARLTTLGNLSSYVILPGGDLLTPPGGNMDAANPVVLPTGDVGWRTWDDGKILRSDGSQWLGSWADPRQIALDLPFTFLGHGFSRAIVSARAVSPSGPDSNFLVALDSEGDLDEAYSVPSHVTVTRWLGLRVVVGNVSVQVSSDPSPAFTGNLPALIDFATALINPIPNPFIGEPFVGGRNDVIAVHQGSFARVVNTENTCLNIHSAPGLDTPILDCAAEGVLLVLGIGTAEYPNVVDVDGTQWWSVITPSGTEGFASGQYLER